MGIDTTESYIQFGSLSSSREEILSAKISIENFGRYLEPKPWFLVSHTGDAPTAAIIETNRFAPTFPILGYFTHKGFTATLGHKVDFSKITNYPLSFSVVDARGETLKLPRKFYFLVKFF